MAFTPKSYSKTVTTSSTRSTKVDDGKKKSLLKDNSWIKTNVNEEEKVERDGNFGKTVLSRYKSNESLVSPQEKTSKTESKTITVSPSSGSTVQALSKRFGGSQDQLYETRTTGTKTTVKTEPRKSSTSTTTIKDGAKITETTVTTTKQDLVKSSTKSETLTDKDLAGLNTKSSGDYKTEVITIKSSKDTVDGPTSPVKTTTSIKTYTRGDVSPPKTTSYSVRSRKSTEDQLFDTLIPTSIKSANTDSSDYKTEVVTVKTSKDISDVPISPVKTTTSIKTYTKEDVSPPKTTSYSTKSDYKTEVVTVKSSKDISDVPTSPVKTTTSIKTYTKEDVSPTQTTSYSTKSDYKTEVVTVKTSKDISDVPTSPVKTTTRIKTYTKEDVSPPKTTSYSVRSTKSTEDQLFDTLIPASIKSANTKYDSSREDISVSKSIRTVYSTNERDEWSTVTSPSYSRTSYTESRPVDYLSDTLTSKSTTTVYTSPERVVSGKDICTVCHKNMYTDEKIILDDMNINCHASCFKCGVCNASLGLLKAGDSLWVYRRAIHCESCFGVTKGKWLR
ncbi:mucin-22-like isoform X1 [Carassius carassius]|uniref:mucin-22-like isoform X1 n=1 Tax=Carassius carassius TaxID=217509 RepID=UPI00286944EB|nr:mucin-22-like isoform X1 [Carassius carassius]